MNTRYTHWLAPVALAAAAVAAAPVSAGDISNPDWRFYKPSNTGIPGDFIHTMYIDDQDRPWIAAYVPQWEEGGIARHDGGNVWTTYSNVDYPQIPSHFINDIEDDANGIMWIGTDEGLLRFDPSVGPDSFTVWDTSNSPMPSNAVWGLDVDPDGNVWLACQSIGGSTAGGLARFDPVNDTWDTWTTATGLPWGGQWPGWDWVDWVACQPDASGGFTVWFGSYEMGTATLKDGVFHWFGNTWPPADPMTPTGLPSQKPVDADGNMWIVLWAGLARRAPDGTYTIVGYPDGLDTEVARIWAASGGRAVLGTYMSTAYVWDNGWSFLGDWQGQWTIAFAEDSTGAFWVGGIGGAAKYVEGQMTERWRLTNTGMLSYFVDSIEFDDQGNVYVDANAAPGVGGYDKFDGVKWTCTNDFNYGMGPPWGLPSDNSSALLVRQGGKLVIAPGQLQGAVEWDGSNYTYLIPNGYDVAHLEEDTLGRLWGANDYGIAYLVEADGTFHTFPQGSSQIPAGYIGGIIVDEVNPGWVYFPNSAGIGHTDGVTWEIWWEEELGVPGQIRCMDIADDGTFWIGTNNGLMHYDPFFGQSWTYTTDNTALPSNNIDHITIAPDGSVWITSFDQFWPYPGGVTCFYGGEWNTWTEENSPLPLEQMWSLETREVDGGYEVWVGTAGEAIAVMTVTTAVPGDANGDGVVNFADVLVVISSWGPCGGPCAADVNGDGVVNFADVLAVIANWS
ncbi:MAG: two-component regulator propeller domain-containing protein [Planctomycetota bacterium]|jgi:ligand-binding sensor domain-containing protein